MVARGQTVRDCSKGAKAAQHREGPWKPRRRILSLEMTQTAGGPSKHLLGASTALLRCPGGYREMHLPEMAVNASYFAVL